METNCVKNEVDLQIAGTMRQHQQGDRRVAQRSLVHNVLKNRIEVAVGCNCLGCFLENVYGRSRTYLVYRLPNPPGRSQEVSKSFAAHPTRPSGRTEVQKVAIRDLFRFEMLEKSPCQFLLHPPKKKRLIGIKCICLKLNGDFRIPRSFTMNSNFHECLTMF